ncbi:nucleotidyltransferase domain-containing protein, partial [Geofilum rubicundum]
MQNEFGSRAMGNYRPGSDIDLAIKGSQINQTTS